MRLRHADPVQHAGTGDEEGRVDRAPRRPSSRARPASSRTGCSGWLRCFSTGDDGPSASRGARGGRTASPRDRPRSRRWCCRAHAVGLEVGRAAHRSCSSVKRDLAVVVVDVRGTAGHVCECAGTRARTRRGLLDGAVDGGQGRTGENTDSIVAFPRSAPAARRGDAGRGSAARETRADRDSRRPRDPPGIRSARRFTSLARPLPLALLAHVPGLEARARSRLRGAAPSWPRRHRCG